MWSSKLQSSSSSSSSSNIEPQWVGCTGAGPPTLPHRIPMDGTLELDVGRHTPTTRIVATVPLKYNQSTRAKEQEPKPNEDVRKKEIRMYINEQGHTVKLARLASPPLSYSIPLKGKKYS